MLDRGRHEMLAAGALAGADHRAELGGGIVGAADFGTGKRLGHALQYFGLALLGHEHPGAEHAALAGVGQADRRGCAGGTADRIGQVDLRRLAAEFQHQALERRRRLLGDEGADGARTGEGDQVDPLVGGHQLAALEPAFEHDVEHAVGQAGLGRGLGEDQRRDRGQRIGPKYNRVAAISAGTTFQKAV